MHTAAAAPTAPATTGIVLDTAEDVAGWERYALADRAARRASAAYRSAVESLGYAWDPSYRARVGAIAEADAVLEAAVAARTTALWEWRG